MAKRRLILEMGTGNDLYGEDYTKAATRAVQDALHHSSLVLFRSLELEHDAMMVDVTIGVPEPKKVDKSKVASQIPFGTVAVTVRKGGLSVIDPDNDLHSIVANAGIEAWYDIPEGKYKLTGS